MVKCLYLLGPFHKYAVLLNSYKIKTSKILKSSKNCIQNSGDKGVLSAYSTAEIADLDYRCAFHE
jgi:hypothetical protein